MPIIVRRMFSSAVDFSRYRSIKSVYRDLLDENPSDNNLARGTVETGTNIFFLQ